MSASAIKFLERKRVIQFFGLALVLAPFVNAYLVLYTKMQEYKLTWAQISIVNTLKSGVLDNYVLSIISIVIGIVMLRGSTKAWRAALFLVGFHIAVQILNYKTGAKGNILWWPFLIVNVAVFMFIADQLVWKIEIPPQPKSTPQPPVPQTHKVVQLKTYRKIYLKHDGHRPWAEVKNMTSEGFQAHSLQNLSADMIQQLKNKTITLKLSTDLTLRAHLTSCSGSTYHYQFFHQHSNHDRLINAWFKKIAV